MPSKQYDIKLFNGTLLGSWEVERGFCDIYDCADKIIYLYNNPNLRKEMGKNGRKAVLEKYTFDNVGKAFEEIINKNE
jgi:glycosyltransferase involved in cell wall biosynthesis